MGSHRSAIGNGLEGSSNYGYGERNHPREESYGGVASRLNGSARTYYDLEEHSNGNLLSDISLAGMMALPQNKWRAKLYQLNRQGSWDDLGTGEFKIIKDVRLTRELIFGRIVLAIIGCG